MKLAIIGASKGVGLQTTKRALERGHEVFTLSRTKVPLLPLMKLHSTVGNALNLEDLQNIIQGMDGILITLGSGRKTSKTNLMEQCILNLLTIHQQTPITIPVIILSSFGTGESLNYSSSFPKMIFKTILKNVYADKEKMEELVKASTLNWEIIRPGMLTKEPRTEQYRVEPKLYEGINIGKISRKDVADYMIKEIEAPQYLKEFVNLTAK